MATRGTLGYRQNGQDHLWYNHFDSYPENLGVAVINTIQDSIKVDIVPALKELVKSDYKENNEFIKNSLFCTWGYIVNLDDRTLEVYVGGQSRPHDRGRYANEVSEDGYYGCALILTLDFEDIPEDEREWREIVRNAVEKVI